MPHIRPFTNFDPPAVTAIWQRCAARPGLTQPVSVDLFERLVFGKLYFPESRIFLAFEGDEPIGFAHAGFGPNADRTWLSTETGVVCILLICPETARSDELALDLVGHCEEYLVERGARTLIGGCSPPHIPFYAGLYGGSLPPGILTTDRASLSAFEAAGYLAVDRTLVFRRSLVDFRAPIDRRMMQIRRSMQFRTIVDPAPRDWWEAATLGEFDLTRFELLPPKAGQAVASLTVRDMGPPSPELPGPAAGILDLFIDPAHRRTGLATFLVGEAIKQLTRQGVVSIEAHLTAASHPGGRALCSKLGLQEAAEAVRFRKTVATPE